MLSPTSALSSGSNGTGSWEQVVGGPAYFSIALAAAMRSLQRGVSSVRSPQTEFLLSAIERSPPACSSWRSLPSILRASICTPDNSVRWNDSFEDAAHAQDAPSAPLLDALLHTSDARHPVWMSAPSGAARRVATMHYVSSNTTACESVAPYVFRLHYYCDVARDGGDAALWMLERARPESSLDAPWMAAQQRPADAPRCEFHGFVELPSLCVPPFDDVGVLRLDELLRRPYADRHGYTSSSARQRALTYGELTSIGILQVVDALARDSVDDNDRHQLKGEVPTRALLQPSDLLVDVGSGLGKLVLAIGVLAQGARAVGIEIESERAALADVALRDAKRWALLEPAEAARLELRQGDATAAGVLPADTSLAYLSNLCFGPELSQAIVRRLLELPKLRCIAALREIDDVVPAASSPSPPCQLEWRRSLRVSTTWDEHSKLHIYCCRR